MKILVTGATGTVGRHVVDRLLAGGVQVRALTRRPEHAGLPAQVEVVGADLEQPDTLEAAFQDVDQLYLVVSGATEEVVNLARKAQVRRIVVLSTATAAIDGDMIGGFHRAAEIVVENSGLAWTHIRPGMFAANLLDWADAIRTEGVVRAPYEAARQAPLHEVDVAEVAATALLADGHDGRIHTLSGPQCLTKSEQVAAISQAIGRPVSFEELTPEQWRANVQDALPSYVAEWLLGLWAKAVDNPEPVLPTVQEVLGRPPRPLAEWASDHAADFRSEAAPAH
ncbi:NAD(P)H-binding protein [Micromonospora chokoriensis]